MLGIFTGDELGQTVDEGLRGLGEGQGAEPFERGVRRSGAVRNLPEQGALQTKLFEINLLGGAPQVVEGIFAAEMFSHYDRPRIAQLCARYEALGHSFDVIVVKPGLLHKYNLLSMPRRRSASSDSASAVSWSMVSSTSQSCHSPLSLSLRTGAFSDESPASLRFMETTSSSVTPSWVAMRFT